MRKVLFISLTNINDKKLKMLNFFFSSIYAFDTYFHGTEYSRGCVVDGIHQILHRTFFLLVQKMTLISTPQTGPLAQRFFSLIFSKQVLVQLSASKKSTSTFFTQS
jgi:hypothetical protein